MISDEPIENNELQSPRLRVLGARGFGVPDLLGFGRRFPIFCLKKLIPFLCVLLSTDVLLLLLSPPPPAPPPPVATSPWRAREKRKRNIPGKC